MQVFIGRKGQRFHSACYCALQLLDRRPVSHEAVKTVEWSRQRIQQDRRRHIGCCVQSGDRRKTSWGKFDIAQGMPSEIFDRRVILDEP